MTVVSGLARGVDSAAHRGALTTGRTIAVLGSGVDCIYPPEHKPLAAQIAEAGARRQRISAGNATAAAPLSAAESPDQRTLARRRRDRGLGEVGVADHRWLCARTGSRGHGRARQCPERPEPRRPCPPQGRRKDCRDCGRYRRGTRVRSGAESFGQPQGQVLLPQQLLRIRCCGRWSPEQAYDLDALAIRSGLDARRLLPRLIELELAGLVRRRAGVVSSARHERASLKVTTKVKGQKSKVKRLRS